MTLSDMVAHLVGAVEGLVAIDVGTLVPGLLVLPHMATIVTGTVQRLGTSVGTVDGLSSVQVSVGVVRRTPLYWTSRRRFQIDSRVRSLSRLKHVLIHVSTE